MGEVRMSLKEYEDMKMEYSRSFREMKEELDIYKDVVRVLLTPNLSGYEDLESYKDDTKMNLYVWGNSINDLSVPSHVKLFIENLVRDSLEGYLHQRGYEGDISLDSIHCNLGYISNIRDRKDDYGDKE